MENYKGCPRCGYANQYAAHFCAKCGFNFFQPQQPVFGAASNYGQVENPNDRPSFGWAFLSFLFPIIGLILMAVWWNSTPKQARNCLHGIVAWLITVILGAVLAWLIIFVILGYSIGFA
ncbi:MAG: hypothetical protein LBI43_03510 [Streptococcaceae bacterium]|jgi:hypothetical protein|nr:hypothetical protein [Streptococcaceae bacterium]